MSRYTILIPLASPQRIDRFSGRGKCYAPDCSIAAGPQQHTGSIRRVDATTASSSAVNTHGASETPNAARVHTYERSRAQDAAAPEVTSVQKGKAVEQSVAAPAASDSADNTNTTSEASNATKIHTQKQATAHNAAAPKATMSVQKGKAAEQPQKGKAAEQSQQSFAAKRSSGSGEILLQKVRRKQ